MGDSDYNNSENKREQKKRSRKHAEDDCSSSSESSYERKKKKHRHKDRKKKSKKRAKERSRKHESRKRSNSLVKDHELCAGPSSESLPTENDSGIGQNEDLQQQQEQLRKQEQARRMVPMSREEYQAQQSKIREIYDEQTGRYRLVRGTGEIIESLVSRSQHETINRQATRGDGASFSRDIFRAAHR